jgi:hypothetical protein
MKNPHSVFISYSHRDGPIVRKILGDVLRNLPEGEFQFWDDSRVAPGSNWAAEVAHALERSTAMVVFVSPDYLSSQWSQRELEFALTSARYAGRLIPVLLQPTPKAPWILERLQYINATEDATGAGRKIAHALKSGEENGK